MSRVQTGHLGGAREASPRRMSDARRSVRPLWQVDSGHGPAAQWRPSVLLVWVRCASTRREEVNHEELRGRDVMTNEKDPPSATCATRCDHGSRCVLPTGHAPASRHETENGCICYDPREKDPPSAADVERIRAEHERADNTRGCEGADGDDLRAMDAIATERAELAAWRAAYKPSAIEDAINRVCDPLGIDGQPIEQIMALGRVYVDTDRALAAERRRSAFLRDTIAMMVDGASLTVGKSALAVTPYGHQLPGYEEAATERDAANNHRDEMSDQLAESVRTNFVLGKLLAEAATMLERNAGSIDHDTGGNDDPLELAARCRVILKEVE